MTEAHSQRAHAKLSPSSAHRWISCPGSIRMSEGIEDKGSSYAAEGTAAHTLAEVCLRGTNDGYDFLGRVIDTVSGEIVRDGEADGQTRFEVDDEMADSVQEYLDYIRGHTEDLREEDVFEVESRLDLTHVSPDMFGTGDALIYIADAAHLYVCDFKYGRGVAVEPEENEQLLTYAVGAIKRYHNRPLARVTLAVIQPRAPHKNGGIREWTADPMTVLEFEHTLRLAAEETRKPDAPLVAGDHCKFCKAAPICPVLRDAALSVAMSEFADDAIIVPPVTLLSPDEIAKTLQEAQIVKDWVKRVEEFAHAQALAGSPPTGFKLVEKRATRKWVDEALVPATLDVKFGLSKEDLYAEPKLKSPAQIEKIIGKKNAAGLKPLCVAKSSGLVLAPIDDPRPAAKPDASEEFTA